MRVGDLEVNYAAILAARALRRDVDPTDDGVAAGQVAEYVLAGAPFPSCDARDGTPQTIVWLTAEREEPWGAAVVKGSTVVTVLRPGQASKFIRDARKRQVDQAGLDREPTGDDAVLLRYRSLGVPGVLAVEVMRDGTARYVLVPRPVQGNMSAGTETEGA